MVNNKKILILGGEGFIGRNVANFLSDSYDCYSLGIEKSALKDRKDVFIKKNPYKEKNKNDYDVIIHLIDNHVAIKKFLEEERKLIKNIGLNDKNHLILFSSAVIYANPDSDYGKRKTILEEFYQDCCGRNNIKLTILRPFNLYGSYQFPNRQGSLVANIFYNYLEGKTTEINDIECKRDFMYAEDLAKFVKYSIKSHFYGISDVSTNKLTSIRELLKSIEKVLGEKILILNKKNKEKISCPTGKNILLKKIELTPMAEGLEKTFIFYKRNIGLIDKIISHE